MLHEHLRTTLNPYVRIARPDHWIKQLFILPGVALAFLFDQSGTIQTLEAIRSVFFALLATSLIASANYVINEWLDRDYDRYHPVKKHRPAVAEGLNAKFVYLEWTMLTVLGLVLVWKTVNTPCFIMCLLLWLMGIVYNVRPMRSKDVAYVDVLTESLNNAIRLLIGWFALLPNCLPPSSLVLGYWMAGAYLMAIKRFSEYRAIGDPSIAGLYRKSFKFYTERSLLNSSLFYAMFSVFLLGVFLVKYHIEYVLLMPFLCGLYVLYFDLSFGEDSVAQSPEKLYREKGLMAYVVFFMILFVVLTFVRIPVLDVFLETVLIGI